MRIRTFDVGSPASIRMAAAQRVLRDEALRVAVVGPFEGSSEALLEGVAL